MAQNIPEFDIAIVGAGIAGSALACALSNTDLRVVVVEGGSFPDAAPACDCVIDGFDSRASALTLASKSLFEQLGVWENILLRRAEAFSDMFVWDGEGTGEIAFSASEISEPALGYIVENRVIVYSLLESLRMSTNVKMLDKLQVKALNNVPDDSRFNHSLLLGQESGEDMEIKAELIVGADGANSFIRQACQFQTREWDYGHHAIVCTIQTEKPHQHTAWQRFMHTGPVALLPFTAGENANFCSIVWSAEDEKAERIMALDDESFTKALTQETEARLGNVLAASKRYSFPLRQRHSIEYVKEGVALIADAAHTIHPLAGQGINLGLQDVRVLAEELLKAKESGQCLGDMRVLSRYQRRRKGDNLMMMSIMEGFKRLFAQQSLTVRWLRNRGMLGLGRFELLKRQIMKQAMGVHDKTS